MKKKTIKLSYFALIISLINLALYHLPFYKYACNNLDFKTFNGIIIFVSLTILAILVNALIFYIGLYLLRTVGKWVLVIFFNINAVAIYFINIYHVIIDKTLINNILNTNVDESSSFFSIKLILYFIILGVMPSILIFKFKILNDKLKPFLRNVFATLIFLLILAFANSSNWLWIDKNSRTLGGLAMPWSYVVNTSRSFYQKSQKNETQILLPNITNKDNKKSVLVLVIGESARSENFSLNGYKKNTNPLLSKIDNVHSYKALSGATYTTAGLKCILEYKNTSKLFEVLPNYLYRNGVDVFWKSTNTGEPKINIKNIQKLADLKKLYGVDTCKYDEVLLRDLNKQILSSKKNKILFILHTRTSHGPTYYKKYPPQFNKFTPVCKSVDLSSSNREELINAYDNTIVYTDYILATLIQDLKQLKDYNSSMIFISDHGESLGEDNLYMHGMPFKIAPKEQKEIPFIVWLSDDSIKLKENKNLTQHNIFHSVLDFLGLDSPIYDENKSIFVK